MLRLFDHSRRKSQIREEARILYYKRHMQIEAELHSFLKARSELMKLERYAAEADLSLQMTREVLSKAMRQTAEGIGKAFPDPEHRP